MSEVIRYTDTDMIKKIMIDKGYSTISSLAAAAGIDRNVLGKVLSGKIQPSSTVMYKLVDTLGISAAEAGVIFFAINLRTA